MGVILAMIASVVPADQRAVPNLTTSPAGPGDAVSVPDHPEGTSFNPTQIKDIRAADPSSNLHPTSRVLCDQSTADRPIQRGPQEFADPLERG